jgi:RHS repeat-associated protein
VGAPIRLLDAEGVTTWTSRASTWGATDADAAMPLRFPGQYHDTETGLFYNLHRYYNPDTGRYITADPLGLAPSPNPHTYVTNPTTTIDPLGLSAETHGLHHNGTNAGDDLTRVGRWMGEDELLRMQKTGLVQEGGGGRTFVTNPADPAAFLAGEGVFVEFDVPTKSLFPAGKPEWSVIPGPNVGTTRFGPPPSQMPPATCLVEVCRR